MDAAIEANLAAAAVPPPPILPGKTPSPSKLAKIKQEPISPSQPKFSVPNPRKKMKSDDEKPRVKRTYTKRQPSESNDGDKPAPKKRGRKRKQDLPLLSNEGELSQPFLDSDQIKLPKSKNKSPSASKIPKNPRKPVVTPKLKSSGPVPQGLGSCVFNRNIFAGPHLTMKQVLEYILTDHSYCVPPDPLPAVGSNHQMIRYVLGPKDGAKATPLQSVGAPEAGNNAQTPHNSVPPSRPKSQLASNGTASPSSKLEQLLKRDSPQNSSSASTAPVRLAPPKSSEVKEDDDLEIDVESVEPEPERRIMYDVQRARDVMNECEKYVEFARGRDTGDDWESKILKTGWTKNQAGLFEKVIGALHAERLARLTYEGVGDSEPVLRRSSIDRTACRVRRIFGEYFWDTKLTQWLHGILTESLNFKYLAIYLDVLQTLKANCPQLVSRMMKLSVAVPLQNAFEREDELQNLLTPFLESESRRHELNEASGSKSEPDGGESSHHTTAAPPIDTNNQDPQENAPGSSMGQQIPSIYLPERSVVPQMTDAIMKLQSAKHAEALKSLLDRQWDPFSSTLFQRLKKLNNNPVFILLAPGAIFPKMSLCRRLKQYYRMFGRIGQIAKVNPPRASAYDVSSASSYLDKLVQLAKDEIRKTRLRYPERPLYLVGWGSGSILAAKLSIIAGPLDGIVALGFPLISLRDVHDDILKVFIGLKHPTLFVIGGLASNNSLTDMELFRRRLTCETSLVVVGSGNENLYVSRDHRERLLVTQSYVDKTVMDEVAYFVNLHSKHNQVILPIPNISMRQPQFPKFPGNADPSPISKSIGLLRGKKRKSSLTGTEGDGLKRPGDGINKGESTFPAGGIKRELPSLDYDNFAPPNAKSSNKRKSSLTNPRTESPAPTTNVPLGITASQLLQQQTGSTKKRSSKPSNVNRPSLLSQPQQKSGLGDFSDSQSQPVASSSSLNTFSGGSFAPGSSVATVAYSMPGESSYQILGASASESSESEKLGKKKTGSKAKASRPSKATSDTANLSLLSGTSEVMSLPLATSTPNPVPASAMNLPSYVLQQPEKSIESEAMLDESSKTYDFILPDVDTSMITSEGTTVQTAYISNQNIASGMSFPYISLSQPSTSGVVDDTSTLSTLTTQSVNTSSTITIGSEFVANLLASGGKDKIFFKAGESGVGVQLISLGVTAQDLLAKSAEETETGSELTSGDTTTTLDPVAISLPSSLLVPTSNDGLSEEPAFITPDIEPASGDEEFVLGAGETETSEACVEASVEEASVEVPPQSCVEEPMEVDTDEEMSCLKISSTFSVCPTSGERVDTTTDSDGADNGNDKADPVFVPEEESQEEANVECKPSIDIVKATADAISSVIFNSKKKSEVPQVTEEPTTPSVPAPTTKDDDSKTSSAKQSTPKPVPEKISTERTPKKKKGSSTHLPVKLDSKPKPKSTVSTPNRRRNSSGLDKGKEVSPKKVKSEKKTPAKSTQASFKLIAEKVTAEKSKQKAEEKVDEEEDASSNQEPEKSNVEPSASTEEKESTETAPVSTSSASSETSEDSKTPRRRSARLKSGF